MVAHALLALLILGTVGNPALALADEALPRPRPAPPISTSPASAVPTWAAAPVLPAQAAPGPIVSATATWTPPAPNDIPRLIAEHAARNGLPVLLAQAVVSKESRGNPRATGNGTIGLMQIKLATAQGIGYLGTVNALYDPGTNLTWGMRYLGRAYQDAGGDICGTVVRYKTGHAAGLSPAAANYCADIKRMMATD